MHNDMLRKGKTEEQTHMLYLLVKALHAPQLLHPSSIPPDVLMTYQAQLVVTIL